MSKLEFENDPLWGKKLIWLLSSVGPEQDMDEGAVME